MKLGSLKKVDLRTVWKHEATDFSTWLAKEENLSLLGDEIGVDIRLIKTEANVGRYNVDILAEEENTGKKVIIENQLEITDHDHLGKLMTYAAGYDASVIIWIVDDVRDEHKRAIDWINEHTDDEVNCFIIQMELWKINESECAPKFQIISKPNEWAKVIKESGSGSKLSDTKVKQLEFWTSFKEYASKNKTTLRLRKAHPQHWYDIGYGSTTSHLDLSINTQKGIVGCEVWIPDSKDTYFNFLEKKDEIESALGEKLDWMELPEKKASRIKISRNADITQEESWEEYLEWLLAKAESFKEVFIKHSGT